MNRVEKIRYALSYFDIELMKPGARTVYDLFPDGRVSIKEYEPGCRKIKGNCLYQASPEAFEQMYRALRLCIEAADHLEQYVDDSDAELVIYHEYDRVERMPRGLGNEEITVGRIIENYVFDNSKKG